MRQKFLKKIRVIISLVVFLFTIFIFIDFAHLFSSKVIHAILFLQFVPSLLDFVNVLTFAATGFIFISLITLLFGRVYCSFLCPLGVFQDIFIGISSRIRKFKKGRRWKYTSSRHILQYSILAASLVLLFLFRSLVFVNLLDPYSISGKMFTNLFRPVYYMANNLMADVFKAFHSYALYPIALKHISWPAVIFSGMLFITFMLLSVFRTRWYCNAICPVGTTLGLLSRVSLFKLRIDEASCNACGACERKCKAGCIDYRRNKIDFDRCVACFNCIPACPSGGVGYHLSLKKENTPVTESGKSRRNFLKTSVTGVAGLGTVLSVKKIFAANEKTSSTSVSPVTPPGSVSIWHFRETCTACHLCINACPTKVLQPAFLEYGLSGLFQPRLDYHTEYCNFECIRCSEVCPTGAIFPVTKEEKSTIQIGISKFIKNLCVVVANHTACAACSEHCPTKAVEMVPYLGDLKIPQIDEKICVGCGACEFACPVRPERSIYVEAHNYHHTAMKPLKKVEGEKKEKEVKPADDFPF